MRRLLRGWVGLALLAWGVVAVGAPAAVYTKPKVRAITAFVRLEQMEM